MKRILLRLCLPAVLSMAFFCAQAWAMEILSTAFEPGGDIPRPYTCDGDDKSPPLVFRDVPPMAKSLALVMEDPDAPDPRAPRMVWVHWLLFNLPPDIGFLPEGLRLLPSGAGQGLNDWRRTGYGGPCPPIGRHRYVFRLYALDIRLEKLREPARPELMRAMQGHILEQAVLIGRYGRR